MYRVGYYSKRVSLQKEGILVVSYTSSSYTTKLNAVYQANFSSIL